MKHDLDDILIPLDELVISDATLKRLAQKNDIFKRGQPPEGNLFWLYAKHLLLSDPELRAMQGLGDLSEEQVFYNAYFWLEAANLWHGAEGDEWWAQQVTDYLEGGGPEDLDVDWDLIEDLTRKLHEDFDLPFPGDDEND